MTSMYFHHFVIIPFHSKKFNPILFCNQLPPLWNCDNQDFSNFRNILLWYSICFTPLKLAPWFWRIFKKKDFTIVLSFPIGARCGLQLNSGTRGDPGYKRSSIPHMIWAFHQILFAVDLCSILAPSQGLLYAAIPSPLNDEVHLHKE